MHSAGFVTKRRRSPIGLGGAVAVHAVVAAIYILTPKELYQKIPVPILLGTPIEAERDPDPLPPPEPEQEQLRQENISVPQPEVKGLPTGSSLDAIPEAKFPGIPGTGMLDSKVEPTPDPVLIDARPDPRYMRDFQPDYPTNLQRLQLEGSVTVRVKIGPDGRVMAVQLVSATHDDFFKVTERQALRRWRFRPATRDGQPVESWREMTVHFRIED